MTKQAKKILIIEDEKALINNLSMALSDNYDILTAITGKEGLKKAQNETPDLILLDIMLPDIDGLQVFQTLQENDDTDGIPVIFLTNVADPETISKIFQAGGKDYLVKSDWSISDILKKIEITI